MKSFLAGLGLGLAAALVYTQRPGRGIRQWRGESPGPAGSEGRARFPRTRAAHAAPPTSRPGEAATRPVPASGASRPEPIPVARARNAEDVLNSATRQQLLSVYGIGPVLADRIIQNRPYAAAYDVVEQGIIPESIFLQLRKQLLEQPR